MLLLAGQKVQATEKEATVTGHQDTHGERLLPNAHGASITPDGRFAEFPDWAFEEECGSADGAPNPSNWRPLEELGPADMHPDFVAMYLEDKEIREVRIHGGANEALDVPDAVFHGNWVRGAWDDHFLDYGDYEDDDDGAERDEEDELELEFHPDDLPSHSAPITSRHRSYYKDDDGWRFATRTVHTREGKVRIERYYRGSNSCGWHGSWKRSRRDYARRPAQG